MDSIAAATGWPNSPTRATSEASPPASGAAVVTSTGVPASVMACTSRRVLLRSNPTCSMGPGLLPSRLSALTSSVLRGEAPVFIAFTGTGSDSRLVALRTSPVGSLSGLSRPGPGWPWCGRCVCGRPACDLVTVGPDEGCAGRWQAEGRGRPDVEDDDLQRRGPSRRVGDAEPLGMVLGGEQGESVADQIDRRHARSVVIEPSVCDPAVEVPRQGLVGGPSSAAGLG